MRSYHGRLKGPIQINFGRNVSRGISLAALDPGRIALQDQVEGQLAKGNRRHQAGKQYEHRQWEIGKTRLTGRAARGRRADC